MKYLKIWLARRRLSRLTKARRDSAIHQQWLRNHNAQTRVGEQLPGGIGDGNHNTQVRGGLK